MEPWVPIVISLITGAAAVFGSWYVTKVGERKTEAEADDTIADTVIKLGSRVGALETELHELHRENAELRQEVHQLSQWSAVLVEQLVKSDVVPMSYDEFKHDNGRPS